MTRASFTAALALPALLACVGAPAPLPPVLPGWHEAGAAESAIDEDERALWKRSEELHEEIRKEELALEDAPLATYLTGVLEALLPRLPEAAPKPSVYVVRETNRQGGTSPNGTIVVSAGILAALENEAQLAALLGHELAHFLARHSLIEKRYEKLSTSTVERMNLARAQEDAADLLGLELMHGAGYDPREIPRMLALLRSDDSAGRTPHPAWESHPIVDARIRRVNERIPPSANGSTETARYEAAIGNLLAVTTQLETDAGLLTRARATLARFQSLMPAAGRGFYLKAELDRIAAPEGRRAAEVRALYERAVELAPEDSDALRALGLLCRELGEHTRARDLLRRYVSAAPQAADRKLIERYLNEATAEATPESEPRTH
jgi:beta-barrel assembly-enhancing protease